jgi:hypothetical protein
MTAAMFYSCLIKSIPVGSGAARTRFNVPGRQRASERTSERERSGAIMTNIEFSARLRIRLLLAARALGAGGETENTLLLLCIIADEQHTARSGTGCLATPLC